MRRGTTPRIKISLKNVNLNELIEIIVSFKQNSVLIDKAAVVSEGAVYCQFTQEETLKFNVGLIQVQIKAKMTNGDIVATGIKQLTMNEILSEEIL